MSMSISGLGSGFDIDSWVSSLVSVKKSNLVTPLQSKLSTLESKNSSLSSIKNKYSTLQSSLKAFTDIVYNSTNDMWTNNSITSSDSSYVTATSSGLVNTSSAEIKVQQIATSTVAKGSEGLGTDLSIENSLFTSLANNQGEAGTFSLFLDGVQYEVEIEETDTLGNVIQKIKDLGKETEESEGVFDVEFNDGKLSITPKDSEQEFTIGSQSDTSNFASVLKLSKNENDNGYSSTDKIGSVIENSLFTSLANNKAKSGTFSLFLDGRKYEVEIEETDTLGNVIQKIKDLGKETEESEGVFDVEFNDGKLSITPKDSEQEFTIGSSSDTSNFASVLKLSKNENDNGFSSAYKISKVNAGVAISSSDSGFEGVTFTGEDNSGVIRINGVEIAVNENTTINDLVSKINGTSDTHVKASYDSLLNQFILTSTETGASNIALSEENTNLLNKLGLTEGSGENEVLKKGSQKLGENAIVYVNDNKIISNSNTITGESSGITNLSITVKKPTIGGEDAPESVSLTVKSDYSKVKSALSTFVNAYNDVVTATKSAVATDGSMAHDSSLNSILSSLRSITTMTSTSDGAFSMLSQIGITTSSSDPSKLSIDDTKLDDALNNDFESVKKLLSDGYVAKEDAGVFDKLIQNVNAVLDTNNGYFATKTESINSQIKMMNTRIERANTQLTKYETRITAQFNRMDSVLSQLSTQLTTFQAYIGG